MLKIDPKHGLGTLVNHVGEGPDPRHSHVTPIYQSSISSFPDAKTGASIFKGETLGYIYTRLGNPNLDQYAGKIAMLEGLDLLRARPETPVEETVAGIVFGSGMVAVTAAILGWVRGGQTIIAQETVYSATYNFLCDLAPLYNIQVVWLSDVSLRPGKLLSASIPRPCWLTLRRPPTRSCCWSTWQVWHKSPTAAVPGCW
jgi:methionine-gamma-lyase